jgi:hypothetical protein
MSGSKLTGCVFSGWVGVPFFELFNCILEDKFTVNGSI